MRRIGSERDEDGRLWVYDGIIRCYLRYVAIRCAELTNSKEEAGRIACCALVKTCLLVEQLEHAGQIGRVVDKMVDAGGKEALRERRRVEVEGAETSGGILAPSEGETA
jgi:hypothetical protein